MPPMIATKSRRYTGANGLFVQPVSRRMALAGKLTMPEFDTEWRQQVERSLEMKLRQEQMAALLEKISRTQDDRVVISDDHARRIERLEGVAWTWQKFWERLPKIASLTAILGFLAMGITYIIKHWK